MRTKSMRHLALFFLFSTVAATTAFIDLKCPQNIVFTKNVTVSVFSMLDGKMACDPIQFGAHAPDGTPAEFTKQECAEGRTNYVVNLTSDGKYRANATFQGKTDACIFASAGNPPQAVPEADLAVILLAALAAAGWAYRKR